MKDTPSKEPKCVRCANGDTRTADGFHALSTGRYARCADLPPYEEPAARTSNGVLQQIASLATTALRKANGAEREILAILKLTRGADETSGNEIGAGIPPDGAPSMPDLLRRARNLLIDAKNFLHPTTVWRDADLMERNIDSLLRDLRSPEEPTEDRRPTGQCSWGCYYASNGRLVRDSACTVHGASSENGEPEHG